MAMNQLRSELEQGAPAARGQAVAWDGPPLSAARIDRLLAEPAAMHDVGAPAKPPPMQGIWLGAVAGLFIWAALAAAYLLLL
jgi:hypothetical protein